MWRMVIEQRTTRPNERHTLKHQNSRRIHGYLSSSYTTKISVVRRRTAPVQELYGNPIDSIWLIVIPAPIPYSSCTATAHAVHMLARPALQGRWARRAQP